MLCMPLDEPDPLSGLAPLLRVRPELQLLCRFGAQWASPHPPEAAGWAPFHLVTQGVCVLDMDDAEPTVLHAGDVVLLPHGDAHVMRGLQTAPGSLGIAGISVRHTSAIPIRFNTDHPEAELI